MSNGGLETLILHAILHDTQAKILLLFIPPCRTTEITPSLSDIYEKGVMRFTCEREEETAISDCASLIFSKIAKEIIKQ